MATVDTDVVVGVSTLTAAISTTGTVKPSVVIATLTSGPCRRVVVDLCKVVSRQRE